LNSRAATEDRNRYEQNRREVALEVAFGDLLHASPESKIAGNPKIAVICAECLTGIESREVRANASNVTLTR
jgi:hypothetical protein